MKRYQLASETRDLSFLARLVRIYVEVLWHPISNDKIGFVLDE